MGEKTEVDKVVENGNLKNRQQSVKLVFKILKAIFFSFLCFKEKS